MHFDYQKFSQHVEASKRDYNERAPFPYDCIDGLFDESLLKKVNVEIDESKFKKDVRSIKGVEVKTRSDFAGSDDLPNSIRNVFETLNGARFLTLLSELTGIGGLIPDPYHDGGGVNIIENGGTLAVHVDGTTQRRMKICRRLNVILFLNEFWDPDWGGCHEQWQFLNKDLSPFSEDQEWKCIRKIIPRKNRLYIFSTNDHTWHGHAGVLKLPKAVQRRSLILYYYTSTRPENEILYGADHRSLFINNKITLNGTPFDQTVMLD
jgi:hypothetical protein